MQSNFPQLHTYERKTSDCLLLVKLIRQHYNASPLPKDYNWIFEQYPYEASQPIGLVRQLLERDCQQREGPIQHLDLLCLVYKGFDNLGTAIEMNGEKFVSYMGSKGSQLVAIARMSSYIESVWYLE